MTSLKIFRALSLFCLASCAFISTPLEARKGNIKKTSQCCPIQCCSKLDSKAAVFEFSLNNRGWQANFADYLVGQEAFFELTWGRVNLPKPVQICDTLTKGIFLSGNNHSDDLLMYISRPIDGLKPLTEYAVVQKVFVLNNVPPGQVGVGGSPGEDVYFKIGASTIKPIPIVVNGFYRINVDIGSQSQGGKNARVVGNMANANVNPSNPQYELFPSPFTNEDDPLIIRTDECGRLWIFVGTDSGYEGLSDYYIAKICAAFTEVASNNCEWSHEREN